MGAAIGGDGVHGRWLRFGKQLRLDLSSMMEHLADILVAVLAAALIVATITDLRERRISNRVNATIALLAIPFWVAAGLSLWPEIAMQVAFAAGALLLFGVPFYFGWMGGGDVKLIVALALWLPPLVTVKLLVIMSLAGCVLTVAMVVRHRLTKAEGRPQTPYGVAIAFAGLCLIGQRYLNQFG